MRSAGELRKASAIRSPFCSPKLFNSAAATVIFSRRSAYVIFSTTLPFSSTPTSAIFFGVFSARETMCSCKLSGIFTGFICGHCIKKLEPISNRTPNLARSACVVALTRKVRSDRVRTPPRAEYRASRPLPLPLRFHSRFFAGGIQKRNGRQEAGAASTIHICKLHEERGIVWMYLLTRPHFLFMQNQRGFVGVGVLIAIVLGLIVVGGGTYFVMQQKSISQTTSDISDTEIPTNVQTSVEAKTQTSQNKADASYSKLGPLSNASPATDTLHLNGSVIQLSDSVAPAITI